MGYHSGMWGVIDGQSTVRNFSITHTSTPFMYRASNTKGGTARTDGVKDWTGTFDHLGGVPVLMPGDIFSGKFYTAPDNDVYGGSGKVYLGSAIVDSVVINWDWSAGDAINMNYSFSGVGPLTEEMAFYDDVTPPAEYPICAAKIDYGAALSETDLENVATATLTFSAENQGSVNSSSQCYNKRVAGPIDFTAAITLEDNYMPIAIGTTERFRFWVDGTNFFELKWAIVREYSGLNVDRETGSIIQSTLNLDMDGVDSNGDIGSITLPGAGSAWWPKIATTTAATVAGVNESPV